MLVLLAITLGTILLVGCAVTHRTTTAAAPGS